MKWAVIGLMAALFGTGCAPHPAPLPNPASLPHPDTAHWRMDLAVTPAQPRQLDPAQFQVKVADSEGKPVSGAAVTVQLVMPTMEMGRNAVALHEGLPGVYTGTGRFTMPGDWEAAVSAGKDAAHRSQAFPVSVH